MADGVRYGNLLTWASRFNFGFFFAVLGHLTWIYELLNFTITVPYSSYKGELSFCIYRSD